MSKKIKCPDCGRYHYSGTIYCTKCSAKLYLKVG